MKPVKCEFSDIVVTPDHLDFEIKEGFSFVPPNQYLFINKATPGLSPSWDASTPATWLKLRPDHGSGTNRVKVSVKSIGMPAGEYDAQITIASHVTVTPSVISVKLTVKGEEPPEEPEQPEEPEEPPEEPEEPPEKPEPPKESWLSQLWELIKRWFRWND